MNFSVLLPTRNRLDLLKFAIASVVEQDYQNWEIIVSDNFSDEDIGGYIRSLNDPRIRYFRTEKLLSVTENWNRAYDKSTGDYVIMLGDDDCLMQGYFSTMKSLLEKFLKPDFVYSNSFLYAYPGVLPNHPKGMLRTFGNCGLWDVEDPFLLERKQALELVQKTANFQVAFAYNMQFATISKSFADSLKIKERFFHSPYPDYYAMTLMMLKADRILACPYPLTTVGISPKSFGCFYFNNKEEAGTEVLNNEAEFENTDELKKVFLQGSNMNTSWLMSLYMVRNHFPQDFLFEINTKRYRKLQFLDFAKKTILDLPPAFRVVKILNGMVLRERVMFGFCIISIYIFCFLHLKKMGSIFVGLLNRILCPYPRYQYEDFHIECNNIMEVFKMFDAHKLKDNSLYEL